MESSSAAGSVSLIEFGSYDALRSRLTTVGGETPDPEPLEDELDEDDEVEETAAAGEEREVDAGIVIARTKDGGLRRSAGPVGAIPDALGREEVELEEEEDDDPDLCGERLRLEEERLGREGALVGAASASMGSSGRSAAEEEELDDDELDETEPEEAERLDTLGGAAWEGGAAAAAARAAAEAPNRLATLRWFRFMAARSAASASLLVL